MLTDFSFLQPGAQWPPPSEAPRLRKYQQNKLAFEGEQQLIFKDWVRLLREDMHATLSLVLNWHRRLSVLWADLLLGEQPRFRIEDQWRQQLDDFVKQNKLWTTSYEVAIDVSRYGTGLFKIRWDKQSVVEAVPATVWFPVVAADNVKNIQAHVLAWEYSVFQPSMFGTDKEDKRLKIEIHTPGQVQTQEFTLKDGLIKTKLNDETVPTNVPDFLVVPVHNLTSSDSPYGFDDYTDIDTHLNEIMVRMAQVSRILDKHADPNMYGPDSAMELDPETGQYIFRGGGKYFPVADGEKEPGYIVWDGQIDASFKEIEVLIQQLHLLSNTSPAVFGDMSNARADSGSALKRYLLAPIAHVNRVRMHFDPALKQVIRLANQLDIEYGGLNLGQIGDLDIIWQDGLPKDDKETTDMEVQKYVAGLTSLQAAVAALEDVDGDDLQALVNQIKLEQRQKMVQQQQMDVQKMKVQGQMDQKKMETQAKLNPKPAASATAQAVKGGAKGGKSTRQSGS